MEDGTKQKLAAAARIGFGVFKIGSGIATATGHGLIAAWARKTHNLPTAFKAAHLSVMSGADHIKTSIAQLKGSSS